jgi:hypothetical protein
VQPAIWQHFWPEIWQSLAGAEKGNAFTLACATKGKSMVQTNTTKKGMRWFNIRIF